MRKTKWKWKELFYVELSAFYRVHYNTIRKVIKRARKGDFTVHLSTTKDNLGYNFNNYIKSKNILKIEKNHINMKLIYGWMNLM